MSTEHQWDGDGERCLKCGDKDWFAGPTCSGEKQQAKQPGMTHYCLGNGALKCNGCQQEKNWQTLNQMPDVLRKALQSQAQRIDDTDCILSGRQWYVGA